MTLLLAINDGTDTPPNIDPYIREFNAQSETCYVKVVNYAVDGNLKEGMTRLNTELIAGTGPDIIQVDGFQAKPRLTSKGIFLDLYKFLDADPELNRDDYFLLDILEEDGELPYPPPLENARSFSVFRSIS